MIRNDALESILTPAGLQGEGVTVNLFIVSKKTPKLKKLDLGDLTPEQRVNKLHKWAKDNRFVAVVEKGDMVYALASPQFAEGLQNLQELSINGKKVSVKALSQAESERLSVIGETFEDFIRLNPEEEMQEEHKHEEKSRERRDSSQAYLREYFARADLLSDVIKIDYLILQMRNIPEKVIMAFLKKMQEIRRIEEKRRKEDNLHEEAVALDRKHDDLKKRIRKDEVNKEEIKEQNTKLEQVVQSVRTEKRVRDEQADFARPVKRIRRK